VLSLIAGGDIFRFTLAIGIAIRFWLGERLIAFSTNLNLCLGYRYPMHHHIILLVEEIELRSVSGYRENKHTFTHLLRTGQARQERRRGEPHVICLWCTCGGGTVLAWSAKSTTTAMTVMSTAATGFCSPLRCLCSALPPVQGC
jgi:hypothetical protein